jgi:hypothetical protein
MQFLEYTERKIREKEEWERTAISSLQPPKKMASKEQLDAFYDRLMNDALKRREQTAKVLPRLQRASLCAAVCFTTCMCPATSLHSKQSAVLRDQAST